MSSTTNDSGDRQIWAEASVLYIGKLWVMSLSLLNLLRSKFNLKQQTTATCQCKLLLWHTFVMLHMWPDLRKPGMWDFLWKCSCYIFGKYYSGTNLPPSLRWIARFAIRIEHSLCTHASNIKIEKINCSLKPLLHTCRVYPYQMKARTLPLQLLSCQIWSTKGTSLFCRSTNTVVSG